MNERGANKPPASPTKRDVTQDERVVARQLGRRPRSFSEVCRRCRYDYPQVVLTLPVRELPPKAGDDDGASRWDVFPTVYWLTCPLLAKAISTLEAGGEIVAYERRLQTDADFASAMERSHTAAASERVGLVPADARRRLERERPRQWRALSETGVAGIRSGEGVKCLHAHYADFIGRGDNVIGAEVHEKLTAAGVSVDGTDTCWRWCTVDGAPGESK